jgi:1,4-alpha-glucan branching enzyme
MNDASMIPSLDEPTRAALAEARHANPFAVLGPHPAPGGRVVRAFLPGARAVEAMARDGSVLASLGDRGAGLFEGLLTSPAPYLLRIEWPGGRQVTEDPYAFPLLLSDLDLHLVNEGRHFELPSCLGAVPMTIEGVAGVRFAVWAPNARRVAVVGDFNAWDERRHPMRLRHGAGVWELFVPRLSAGERYKYAILGPRGERLPFKADPLARQTEPPPRTASIVAPTEEFAWTDGDWMAGRAGRHNTHAPISIYEVHLGSWLHGLDGGEPSWDKAIDRLIPYIADLGFTHVELMPIAEHPFGGSWGYQPLSLFAPTARYGAPAGLARFVDACHRAGVGVIIDWVPAHFPNDAHGLARFDGTALYEHEDPREGFHKDWNTLIYNFGRREVQGFLVASAVHWLEAFHLDGLRVDAVASMLYRDYSRQPGEWIPNIHGGRENLEAVGFIRHVNAVVHERCPGAITIAEESTAWPGVTHPIQDGGLGFDYKWNMGWMHDTLRFMQRDPIHRRWHHEDISFGLYYGFSENYILPISHDEVVYGKRSLISKMPGDDWQRFASLRAYLGFMWTHPGKKLLFMGQEFGQWGEWNHDAGLERHLLAFDRHQGIQSVVRDLNRVYRGEGALHALDAEPSGFDWLIREDYDNSVFAYVREGMGGAPPVMAVCNMTPVPRPGYRIGAPRPGFWRELVNTDAAIYGGGNLGNGGGAWTRPVASHGHGQSLELLVPPLATLILRHEG